MTLQDLKAFLGKTAILHMTDGEVANVRVRMIDEEHDDLIVDVLEKSSPARYPDDLVAYTFALAEIASVEPVHPSGNTSGTGQ